MVKKLCDTQIERIFQSDIDLDYRVPRGRMAFAFNGNETKLKNETS